MFSFLSETPHTKDLLSKLSDDLGALKSDLAALVSHTGKQTVPRAASSLAAYGKQKLRSSPELTESPMRYLREHPGQTSVGLAGGLLILGAVGAGIYYLCKSDTKLFPNEAEDHREIDKIDYTASTSDLTP